LAVSAYKITGSIVFKKAVKSQPFLSVNPGKLYFLQEVDDNIHKELANILRQALSCDKKIFPDDLRLLRSRKLFPLGSFITYGKFICVETTDYKIPGIC
jgi:hypothetical protein